MIGQWKGEVTYFFLLLLPALFAVGPMKRVRRDALWEVGEQRADYRLNVGVDILGRYAGQRRFSTRIELGQPLTFKVKSSNGVLVCVVTLERQGERGYRLSYTLEAVHSGEDPRYIESRGSAAVILGRKIRISFLEALRHRQRMYGGSQDGSKALTSRARGSFARRGCYRRVNGCDGAPKEGQVVLSFQVENL